MKPHFDKPFEPAMRFFTPELYARFNSADDKEADRADEEWEAAIRAYREHLDGLRDQMPPQVQKLAGLCLHDAEMLACEQSMEPPVLPPLFGATQSLPGFFILTIRQGDEISSLIYVLWDKIRKYAPRENWPFSKLRTHWLYDEVDVAPNRRGMFVHRVLLSDGSVVEIPFVSALIHKSALDGQVAEQIAQR